MRIFLRYLLVSLNSFMISTGLPILLHEIVNLSEELAFGTALVTAMMVSFILHRFYTFEATRRSLGSQAALFFITCLTSRSLEFLAFLTLHSGLGVHYIHTIFSIVFLSFFIKFFLFNKVVFRSV